MKKNSHAFSLIKALTMSEKRYFKIFSERHTIGSQNKYVVLFDLLDKAVNENDIELKKQLKEVGVNPDFISADKNYLYTLILRSLNDFHDARTINLEVKELLMSIEILFLKGLYHECLKLIEKAEKLALSCENFSLVVDVLMWKKKCVGYSLGLKSATEVNNSIDQYLHLQNNLKQITNYYYKSNLLQANYEKQTKSSIEKKFQEIISEPELKNESKALSYSAKIFFHLIYANYFFAVDAKDKELEHLQKLVNILNDSKTYATENPFDFVSIYNRLLSVKKFYDSPSFFEDIKRLNEFSKKIYIRKEIISQRIFIHTNTHELEYYLINNDFKQALNKVKNIDKEISNLSVEIEPYHMIYFYYIHVVIMIFAGQFHKALKFINTIINNFSFEARPQVYMRIEFLNIVVHFELKNYTLVLSLAKLLLKKNLTQHILLPIEKDIVTALVKICKNSNQSIKEEKSILKELFMRIAVEKQNAKLSTKQLLENYEKWLAAKLKNENVWNLYS